MEGWRDGKGSFMHLFLNVFGGVICVVLFIHYVPLLITSDLSAFNDTATHAVLNVQMEMNLT